MFMKLFIRGRQITLTDSIKKYAEDKVLKVKSIPPISALVVISLLSTSVFLSK